MSRLRRLQRTFESLMLAASAYGAHACGQSDATPAPDAGADATAIDASSADALAALDGAADTADAMPEADAERDCQPSIAVRDATIDGEDICDYGVPCGLEHHQLTHVGATCRVTVADVDGGAIVDAAGFPYCYVVEGQGCTDGSFSAAPGGGVVFECISCFGGAGRRPAGLLRARGRAPSAIGAYFAELAHLEAASVAAFDRLARDLAAHGAPRALVDAALASARDEVRHARAMTALAARFGATPPRVRLRRHRSRSLAAIARENAVEGCANETFGALLAAWQATHARDPIVRRALRGVARDELRHAALAWEIAAWAESKLAPRAALAVRRARERARADAASHARQLPASVREAVGLPVARVRRWLAAELARAQV